MQAMSTEENSPTNMPVAECDRAGTIRDGLQRPMLGAMEHSSASVMWQQSMDRAIPAILVIRVCSVRAFDGHGASYSYATGFIVDKERGIVLTNRHVVTPGPVVADAIFMNKEEVDLTAIYRDPVHDFGFYKFDPAKVRFLTLSEVELNPEGAKVGTEIRVVGNDNGEKLSILPGILARLDREAPFYGAGEYNDFNTFYYCAASSNSGGSSGSPVLTMDGKAVALNCGASKKAASSFYLPLYRVARALDFIKRGVAVPRGTLQTVFKHNAFDEVRRLGLTTEEEALVRRELPRETGLLVVDQVVPKGPGDNVLEPGDVLLSVGGKRVTQFVPLEAALDDNVGRKVQAVFQRGGKTVEIEVNVGDLHAITPDEFIEISAGVVHPLSYQQAKNHNLPCGGVYMAQSGYMLARAGMRSFCLITSVGEDPTPDLDAFETAMEKHPDGTRTCLRYVVLTDMHRTRTAVITVDRTWFPMQRYKRNDITGLWHATLCKPPPPKPLITNHTAAPPPPPGGSPAMSASPTPSGQGPARRAPSARRLLPDGSTSVVTPKCMQRKGSMVGSEQNLMRRELEKRVRGAMVLVSFDVPYMIDGSSSSSYIGAGVIVDAVRGLVVCDRNTVPMPMGDVVLTFNASQEVVAEILFVHPVHNFCVLRFNPAQVQDLGNGSTFTEAGLADEDLPVGFQCEFYGLTVNSVAVYQQAVVTKKERIRLKDAKPPQYTAYNVEVLHFDRMASCAGGVFVDEAQGKVAAFYSSFAYTDDGDRKEVFRGMPVGVVTTSLRKLQLEIDLASRPPGANADNLSAPRRISELTGWEVPDVSGVKYLPIQLETVDLSKARSGMGLTAEWGRRIADTCQEGQMQVLMVRRCVAKTHACQMLQSGDLVLAINGRTVVTFREVEDIVDGCPLEGEGAESEGGLSIEILRDQKHQTVKVHPSLLPAMGTGRVLMWSGLMLQEPHLPVLQMGFAPENGGGVYISRWCYGAPAHKFGVRATTWIVEVNGVPVPTLDRFLEVVDNMEDHQDVRMKTVDLNTKVKVATLRTDYHYWPTLELIKAGTGWNLKRHTFKARPTAVAPADLTKMVCLEPVQASSSSATAADGP